MVLCVTEGSSRESVGDAAGDAAGDDISVDVSEDEVEEDEMDRLDVLGVPDNKEVHFTVSKEDGRTRLFKDSKKGKSNGGKHLPQPEISM